MVTLVEKRPIHERIEVLEEDVQRLETSQHGARVGMQEQ